MNNNKNVDIGTNYSISLKKLCQDIGISYATGKNWIKTGKIIPKTIIKNDYYFESEYVKNIKKVIQSSNTLLKRRRNKKYIEGNNIYKDYIEHDSPNFLKVKYLIDYIEKNQIILDENLIILIITNIALKFLFQKVWDKNISNSIILEEYLQGKFNIKNYDFLIKDLITNIHIKENFDRLNNIIIPQFVYVEKEDLLGYVYISLKNISSRKSLGAYYTPTNVVKKVCEITFDKIINKKILDPSCGTGNFLLNLPQNIKGENVYGNDIDLIAIKICRINYALRFNISDKNIIYSHIRQMDFLTKNWEFVFDYIVGNPPWGASYSKEYEQYLRNNYKTAKTKHSESFDIFVEKAIKILKRKGILSFVLPQSILNVKSHINIREIIYQNTNIQYLEYLGEVFSNVQCPSIILKIVKTSPFSTIGTNICSKNNRFQIEIERNMTYDNFNFNLTDEEFKILTKIEDGQKFNLKNKCKFALGIVTGDNKKYLFNQEKFNTEPIILGTNLEKYLYTKNTFIKFIPEHFQQVAPIELYRAKEKIIYKFITTKPVFSYDKHQILTLNSCNIMIPNVENYNIKYILGILNSCVVNFYFQKKFSTSKVLRSYIENIPIPIIKESVQKKIISLVDKILNTKQESNKKIIEKLDKIIAQLYKISPNEYEIILKSI